MAASLSSLETYTTDLATAAKTLSDYSRDAGAASVSRSMEAPDEVQAARRSILTIIARLQILLAEPAEFIQRLASQVCLPPHRNPLSPLQSPQPKTESCSLEPTARLFAMARRVPGSRVYSSQWKRSHQRCSRPCWRPRGSTRSHRSTDGYRWLPPRASTWPSCSHCLVCSLRYQSVLLGRYHVLGRNRCSHRLAHGHRHTEVRPSGSPQRDRVYQRFQHLPDLPSSLRETNQTTPSMVSLSSVCRRHGRWCY